MGLSFEWDRRKATANVKKHGVGFDEASTLEATMRKAAVTEQVADSSDELREEYCLDYSKARPNRFAGLPAEPRVVVLDPDVAEVFETPDSVNEVLRALIKTLPKERRN